MTTAQLLQEFKQIAFVKTDEKHRVSLGKVETHRVSGYNVYINDDGLIVLDPQVTVPAREAWLYKDKEALRAVKAGLEDLRSGRVKKSKEDYSKHLEED